MRRLLGALFLITALSVYGWTANTKLQTIKVRPGDTLWSISNKYLKNPKRWNVILRHNKLPTNDPTVALPGMTLKVPRSEIKEKFRAATLSQAVGRVFSRDAGKPVWRAAIKGRLLYNGDGLRTRAKSWARVEFFNGGLLSLSPNSMAILKAPKKSDHDLLLKRGSAHSVSARLQTPSARVIPRQKGTKYTAAVLDDLSTRVKVYKGQAAVQDLEGLETVVVRAGFSTEVKLGRVPSAPVKVPRLDDGLQAEIEGINEARIESLVQVRRGPAAPPADGSGLQSDLQRLSIGLPVAAYHVRVTGSQRAGAPILFEKQFDAYEPIDLNQAGLANGLYWVRVSIVDLLGEKGTFSPPRRYRIGPTPEDENFVGLGFQGTLKLIRPRDESIRVKVPRYRILGEADPELRVIINGTEVRKDEDGAFSLDIRLKRGPNDYTIEASDVRGNEKVIKRRIVFDP
jgi:hypothetical protein